MRNLTKLESLDAQRPWLHRKKVLENCLQNYFQHEIEPIKILEAGCGKVMHISLDGIPSQTIGIDKDSTSLRMRQKIRGRLSNGNYWRPSVNIV